jgi:hypothetical protein
MSGPCDVFSVHVALETKSGAGVGSCRGIVAGEFPCGSLFELLTDWPGLKNMIEPNTNPATIKSTIQMSFRDT